MQDKDVKTKMSVCPECGNSIRVAVEHEMDTKSMNEFAEEVISFDLQVKTISLEEYRNCKVEMYCKDVCSRKNKETKDNDIYKYQVNEKGYVWIKPELLNDIIDRLNLLSEAVRLLIKESTND
jgi:diaminopimelate epimerase